MPSQGCNSRVTGSYGPVRAGHAQQSQQSQHEHPA